MTRAGEGAVLVTGAGGPAGVAVVLAVREGRQVVAADCDPDAVGLRLAHDAGVVPRADEPDFVPQLAKLAQRTGATALVCTVAEEIAPLHAKASLLAEVGLRSWLPSPDAVRRCSDKWRFAQVCLDNGVPAPPTQLNGPDGVPGPWIVKPRFGRGSRDVYAATTADDLRWALTRVPEPIVQTRLSGREFTVDALVGRDGVVAGVVPRWRLETKAGISTKGQTFVSTPLRAGVTHLLGALQLVGPANVQGFMTASGEIAFTEVNPRFSGGLPLSLAAGADLVGEYLRGLAGLPVRPHRLRPRPGVKMQRYFAAVFSG